MDMVHPSHFVSLDFLESVLYSSHHKYYEQIQKFFYCSVPYILNLREYMVVVLLLVELLTATQ